MIFFWFFFFVNAVNNLVCGSVFRQCEVAAIPDLSATTPPTKLELDPSSLGFAACVSQCNDVVDTCLGTYLSMIPIAGKILQNMIKSYACAMVEV